MQTWKLHGGEVFTPLPFGIMGIVNLTPDSFFDGGEHANPTGGLQHALQLWQEGAHILDLGAESSRPGAEPVCPKLEQKRLIPVLKPLIKACKKAQNTGQTSPYISIDTYHAQTAETALLHGAHIINDISACLFDPKLFDIIVSHKPGYVLMHSKDKPQIMQKNLQYTDVVDDIYSFLEKHMNRLVQAGLPEEHIVLDPGIGFGKSLEQNVYILQNITKLKALGRPILMGLSMKSFLQGILRLAPADTKARAQGTQTVTALLAQLGIALHRVHHVQDTVHTLQLVQTFMTKGIT